MLVNLGCVDLGFECSNFERLPDPAWALGSLVDVDGQLGKMEEHPNESQRAAGTQADRWETSSAQSELLYIVSLLTSTIPSLFQGEGSTKITARPNPAGPTPNRPSRRS